MLWIATVIAKGQPWGPAAVGGALIAAAVPLMMGATPQRPGQADSVA
jgi:hypothetical protein